MFEPAGLTMSGNGCCKLVNFKGGVTMLKMRDLIIRFYFAAVIRVLARPI